MLKENSMAYLGPSGSYSHQAALSIQLENLVPCPSIPALFLSDADSALIPWENSTSGSVSQSLDTFPTHINSTKIITSRISLSIKHCLMSKTGISGDIKRIYSHPEALSQCAKWLRCNMNEIQLIPTKSTSDGAQLAQSDSESACIASTVCLDLYSLKVLYSDINDSSTNTTKFMIWAHDIKKEEEEDESIILVTNCKLTLVLPIVNILDILHVSSRPCNFKNLSQDLTYNYFFTVKAKRNRIQEVVEKLGELGVGAKYLGSYALI